MEIIPNNPILEFLPDTMEHIKNCYNLDQGRMNEAIDILEEWLAKQQHFVKKDFSRPYLERSLIQCKGSVEKVKTQLDKLCTLKTLLPKFFKTCDVKTELKTISEIVWLIPLPKMTQDYYRTYMIKVNPLDFTSAQFLEYCRMNVVMSEYLKIHDYVKGFVLINDYRNINLMDLITKLNPIELQQFSTILIEGYGARLQGFHLISNSKLIDILANTLKQAFPPKLAGRFYVHSSLESLHSVVEKDILPVEYGGKERSIEILNKQWFEILSSEEHMEYLKEMNAACTNESLRHKDKFNEEYLGMPGTFRTLSAD